jgi:hypothetical protein
MSIKSIQKSVQIENKSVQISVHLKFKSTQKSTQNSKSQLLRKKVSISALFLGFFKNRRFSFRKNNS